MSSWCRANEQRLPASASRNSALGRRRERPPRWRSRAIDHCRSMMSISSCTSCAAMWTFLPSGRPPQASRAGGITCFGSSKAQSFSACLASAIRAGIRLPSIAVGGLETEVVIDNRGRFADRDGIDAWTALVSGIITASPESAVVQQAVIGSRYALASGDILRLVRPAGRLDRDRARDHRGDGDAGGLCLRGVPLPMPPGTWIVAREDADPGGSGEHRFPACRDLGRPRSIPCTRHGEPVSQDRRGRARGGRPPAPALESQPAADQQHCRSSCRYHRCRARIIAVRRGWRQPSACRLSGGRRSDGHFARSSGQRAVRQRRSRERHEDRRGRRGCGRGACCCERTGGPTASVRSSRFLAKTDGPSRSCRVQAVATSSLIPAPARAAN